MTFLFRVSLSGVRANILVHSHVFQHSSALMCSDELPRKIAHAELGGVSGCFSVAALPVVRSATPHIQIVGGAPTHADAPAGELVKSKLHRVLPRATPQRCCTAPEIRKSWTASRQPEILRHSCDICSRMPTTLS